MAGLQLISRTQVANLFRGCCGEGVECVMNPKNICVVGQGWLGELSFSDYPTIFHGNLWYNFQWLPYTHQHVISQFLQLLSDLVVSCDRFFIRDFKRVSLSFQLFQFCEHNNNITIIINQQWNVSARIKRPRQTFKTTSGTLASEHEYKYSNCML